jgi:hypothetical protein
VKKLKKTLAILTQNMQKKCFQENQANFFLRKFVRTYPALRSPGLLPLQLIGDLDGELLQLGVHHFDPGFRPESPVLQNGFPERCDDF